MFGIGTSEFLVILLVAVLVLGPEHLPRIMRTFTKVMSDFRRISTDFQRTINLEASQEEWRKQAEATPVKKVKKKKKPASVVDGASPPVSGSNEQRTNLTAAPSQAPETAARAVPENSPGEAAGSAPPQTGSVHGNLGEESAPDVSPQGGRA